MKRIVLCLFAISAICSGQSTISPSDHYAHSANAGWIDFRPSASDGVVVSESFLAGKAYAANFGWIDFGDGSPNNGHTYSNGSAGDSGVNLSPDGRLTGMAYSANCGWITFEQSHGQPRLDLLTGKLSGHAHGANIGWINLDMPGANLVTSSITRPDTDGDGIADAWEMLHFSGSLETADNDSNADGDSATDAAEYLAGTDPHNPASIFRVIAQATDSSLMSTVLTFSSAPGRLYRIEHDEDLAGIWTDSGLGKFSPDAGGSTTKTIAHPVAAKRFFRAVTITPLEP